MRCLCNSCYVLELEKLSIWVHSGRLRCVTDRWEAWMKFSIMNKRLLCSVAFSGFLFLSSR